MKSAAVCIAALIATAIAISCAETTKPATTEPAAPAGIPKEWSLHRARNAFSFWGPADLKEEKVQGIDSYVGRWTSETMAIEFDYGWYSGKYEGKKYKTERVMIDGRKGTLAIWDGGVGLYVERDRDIKLSIGISCDRSLRDQAIQMLKSLRFGTSASLSGA